MLILYFGEDQKIAKGLYYVLMEHFLRNHHHNRNTKSDQFIPICNPVVYSIND